MRKRNKKILIFLLVVIVLSIFIYTSKSGYIPIFQSNSCLASLIPDNLLIIHQEGTSGGDNIYYPYIKGGLSFYLEKIEYPFDNWKDGQPISINNALYSCHKGLAQGENINYLYCNNLLYLKSTTNISEGGTIGKTQTISYSINLVLSDGQLLKKYSGFEDVESYKVLSATCVKT